MDKSQYNPPPGVFSDQPMTVIIALQILGLSVQHSSTTGFTHSEISKQFKQVAVLVHPDKSDDPQANQKFQKVNEAVSFLKSQPDPIKAVLPGLNNTNMRSNNPYQTQTQRAQPTQTEFQRQQQQQQRYQEELRKQQEKRAEIERQKLIRQEEERKLEQRRLELAQKELELKMKREEELQLCLKNTPFEYLSNETNKFIRNLFNMSHLSFQQDNVLISGTLVGLRKLPLASAQQQFMGLLPPFLKSLGLVMQSSLRLLKENVTTYFIALQESVNNYQNIFGAHQSLLLYYKAQQAHHNATHSNSSTSPSTQHNFQIFPNSQYIQDFKRLQNQIQSQGENVISQISKILSQFSTFFLSMLTFGDLLNLHIKELDGYIDYRKSAYIRQEYQKYRDFIQSDPSSRKNNHILHQFPTKTPTETDMDQFFSPLPDDLIQLLNSVDLSVLLALQHGLLSTTESPSCLYNRFLSFKNQIWAEFRPYYLISLSRLVNFILNAPLLQPQQTNGLGFSVLTETACQHFPQSYTGLNTPSLSPPSTLAPPSLNSLQCITAPIHRHATKLFHIHFTSVSHALQQKHIDYIRYCDRIVKQYPSALVANEPIHPTVIQNIEKLQTELFSSPFLKFITEMFQDVQELNITLFLTGRFFYLSST